MQFNIKYISTNIYTYIFRYEREFIRRWGSQRKAKEQ